MKCAGAAVGTLLEYYEIDEAYKGQFAEVRRAYADDANWVADLIEVEWRKAKW